MKNYSEKELKKINRKVTLRDIIEKIESYGIVIKWNKYPDEPKLADLRQIVLDHQTLVPGEEPDLSEMTDAIDNAELDDSEVTPGKVEEPEEVEEIEEEEEVEIIDDVTVDEVFEEESVVEDIVEEAPKKKTIMEIVEKMPPTAPRFKDVPDWEYIRTIDQGERKGQVCAVFAELLFRVPDATGEQIYVQCLKDGMNIANVRDAIKQSKEYKRKHNLL